MTRFLALGECMVEMAPLADAGTYQLGFAGDTMNTAWYLRRLLPPAHSVAYLTAVGRDAASDQMRAFLGDAGIDTSHIQLHPDRTVGLYMIQLHNGERSFSYWRGQSAARTLAQDPAKIAAALATTDIAYLSGITLAILDPADRGHLLEALRAFRTAGGTVIFDPNLRPRLWSDTTAMTDAIMQAARISDIVLPSFEDEATYFADADPAATATRYAAAGATTVIVKNGADAILAWVSGAQSTHPTVRATHIVDTTSAGDSFNAGFIAGYITGADTAAAIQTGARLAAQVVQARGALVACDLT